MRLNTWARDRIMSTLLQEGRAVEKLNLCELAEDRATYESWLLPRVPVKLGNGFHSP